MRVSPSRHLESGHVGRHVDLQKGSDGEGGHADADHRNGHAEPVQPTVPANRREDSDGDADADGEPQCAEAQEE